MDAVYAWDQSHFDLHVPRGAYFFDPAVVCFQETLVGAGVGLSG